jgi:outer membrane protein assembly factor BamB
MFRPAIALSLAASILLSSCGGGGGGASPSATVGAAPPFMNGSLVSFANGAVPTGYLPAGYNSIASLQVLDRAGGSPVTGATVTLNGVVLNYYASIQTYAALLNVNANAAVNLSVNVAGAVYAASGVQAASFPSVTAPASGTTWSSVVPNVMAWSGVPAVAGRQVALGILDTNGNVVWPTGNFFELLAPSVTAQTIPANSLPAGSLLAWVGAASHELLPGAAPNSGFYLNAFTSVPITVTNVPPLTLTGIAVTPATPTLAVAGTQQLAATGTYNDQSTRDLTTQVTWQSLDSTKATVSAGGLVTAVAGGSVMVTATLGSISGSATVKVFAPNPSPLPPLGQAVAYQIDYAHSGNAVIPGPLSFPAQPTWSTTLDGPAGYPLIAAGKVFVMTAPTGTANGTSLYALNEADGSIAWGPVATAGTFHWGGHAFDHGKVFALSDSGLLQSFDAASGTPGWSVQLPGQYAFSSAPTAVNGVVYTGGAGTGGTVYAVDESDGSILWTQGVANGDDSSPAVSADGVFVSYPCQVYKFDPVSGTTLWHYSGGCEGGGGSTDALGSGLLFTRDWSALPYTIFDASSGAIAGNYAADPIPALGSQTGYFLSAGTLRGITLSLPLPAALWSFAGDGSLVSAPIIVNGDVFVASSSGRVYALDGSTGTQLWSGNAGAAISAAVSASVAQPQPGLGAGEGYLVVPAGSVVTAWRLSP